MDNKKCLHNADLNQNFATNFLQSRLGEFGSVAISIKCPVDCIGNRKGGRENETGIGKFGGLCSIGISGQVP